MIRKKLLIHTIVFSPDAVSTAYLYNDIALGFLESNFDVIVLTTTPHYNFIKDNSFNQPLKKKLFGLYFESNYNGIQVIHIPLIKFKSTFLRVLSFIYWHIFSLLLALKIKKIDFILSPSPPLTIGLISILIAKIKKSKFIYNVQEIYPDFLIKTGKIKSTFIINVLKYIEKFIYNNSDSVITIDQQFYNQIKYRFNDITKLKIISNFVDIKVYKPIFDFTDLPKCFNKKPGSIILLYAGNIGYFQDWEPLFYAANKLKNTNIEFWIVGEGVLKSKLSENINLSNLENIKLFPYQKREVLPLINSYVDFHFISITEKMENEGFPSKIYSIMASSKPLIITTGENSPLYNFFKNINAAILISNDINENFVHAILNLINNKNLAIEIGNNGLQIIHNNYTKEKIIKKYLSLLNSLN